MSTSTAVFRSSAESTVSGIGMVVRMVFSAVMGTVRMAVKLVTGFARTTAIGIKAKLLVVAGFFVALWTGATSLPGIIAGSVAMAPFPEMTLTVAFFMSLVFDNPFPALLVAFALVFYVTEPFSQPEDGFKYGLTWAIRLTVTALLAGAAVVTFGDGFFSMFGAVVPEVG